MGSPSESSFVDSASSDVGIDQNSVDQGSSPDELVEDEDSFAKREGRQLLCLRLSVIAILMVAATAIVSLVSRVSRNAEREEMETQYEGLASKVTEKFISIAQVNMEAVGSLVVAVVDAGINSPTGWPFVTLSSFQRRASTVKDLSGALYIGINPVVSAEDRLKWEKYSTESEDSKWYEESVIYQEKLGIMDLDNRPQVATDDPYLDLTSGVSNRIYNIDRDVGALARVSEWQAFFLPIWQTSPITRRTMINQNRASNSIGALRCIGEDAVVFEGMQYSRPGFGDDSDPFTAEIAWLLRLANKKPTEYEGDIFTTVYFPIHDTFLSSRKTIAVMRVVIHWARFFRNLLPSESNGIVMVLDNSCDEPFTYEINGPEIKPLGRGDLHDPRFDHSMRTASFEEVSIIPDGTAEGLKLLQDDCPYTIRVYQSEKFLDIYFTNGPALITFSVATVFVFTIAMFFVYDRLVERRQHLIATKAQQTNAIVSSLFPTTVRDRLLQADGNGLKKNSPFSKPTDSDNTAAIADLFPQSTVLFADISGFTSWSSSRGPEQVFTLLQTIYQAFDKIAHKLKVFKVETIGDSYVAVTGCPEPQSNHAVLMARFAAECAKKLVEVLNDLETTLGPDTVDLNMRFGIHSGPVIAGVLRGEKSRFQLFGDTVNTAARMESTGMRGRIQASQSTADLLIAAGKGHWVRRRPDSVLAKGKGVVETFWVTPRAQYTSSVPSEPAEDHTSDRTQRSIEWMTTLLLEYVKKIRATIDTSAPSDTSLDSLSTGSTPLEEVVELIQLKEFDENHTQAMATAGTIEIEPEIVQLVREFVSNIASVYHDNPFHNFEHACWVTLSADKFMKRIVAPSVGEEQIQKWKTNNTAAKDIASHLYDYTHGISTDPVALLAVIFSALIHDIDHRGVSNRQLQSENPGLSKQYNGKSVAEQNSLDIAWSIFSSDRFSKLRSYVFATQEDLRRFRQVLVNVVLATDIFDQELNTLRRNRWDKAFVNEDTPKDDTNGLRATIVIEHIIQASDVSHTMQHWHIYHKWNKRLFSEMRQTFRQGRMGADPVSFWYEGELKFFDNYIIPLAKKLKDCNVFGVSSDEVLNYAIRNRAEWADKGKELVSEYVREFDEEFGDR